MAPKKPSTEIIEELESPGANREQVVSVDKVRDELHKRFGTTLDSIRGSQDGFSLRHSKTRYSKWITEEAGETLDAKVSQVKDLTVKKNGELSRFSERTAKKFALLTRQYEVAANVKDALEFEHDQLKPLRDSYARSREYLRGLHPLKSRMPWNNFPDLTDPFDAGDRDVMLSAIDESQKASKAGRDELMKKADSNEKNQKLHGLETELRSQLLRYKPGLLNELDDLMLGAISGSADLVREIDTIFGADPAKKAEKDMLLAMVDELTSGGSRRYELLKRLYRAEVSGKASEVFSDLAKLPLGAKVLVRLPADLAAGPFDKSKEREYRVWASPKGGRVTLKSKSSIKDSEFNKDVKARAAQIKALREAGGTGWERFDTPHVDAMLTASGNLPGTPAADDYMKKWDKRMASSDVRRLREGGKKIGSPEAFAFLTGLDSSEKGNDAPPLPKRPKDAARGEIVLDSSKSTAWVLADPMATNQRHATTKLDSVHLKLAA